MSRRAGIALCCCCAAVAALATGLPAHADGVPATTTAISVTSDGRNPADDYSREPALSADGRYVAFSSESRTLVPGDTNRTSDIFVRDRQTGSTERVSLASAGTQGNKASDSPSISADGRFVAFISRATNLVAGDTNGLRDVFLHDRQTGTTQRIGPEGGADPDSESFNPAMSADGRFVAFESVAGNLVTGDTNDMHDAFVFDRETGRIERVSVDDYGRQANDLSINTSISADGRYVAFVSWASNLDVRPDTNRAMDVFVHDRRTGSTQRVSVAANGTQSPGPSHVAQISADGRHIAFESDGNLVAGDTNNEADMYALDLAAGELTWVSREDFRHQGEAPGRTPTLTPAISADGRYVTFISGQHGLVPNDWNARWDVFVRDVQTGGIERATMAHDGTESAGSSHDVAISADGRYVAFDSTAKNLVPGPDDSWETSPRVFLRDRGN
ncbi:PD40 domain-containing protein [Amorphoplanes digitatis]|uniref:Tol biopolymer transport system component n=1 Tax=Actinoplanes digitatis TaxID=1868 RepID=A0A7W7I0G3_9ACTN|nr:PD40 domain-containing protein [Actinoplanes digitatis]MBB4764159.1 Tol biopolymer transport system component [Actinoplanes digitatis]GID97548.1 hypothetical protein Adi01nite_69600 [Actinoplanes digitatis]